VIAFLTGVLVRRSTDHCLIDVGGIGYRVAMATSSLAALPAEGERTTILTKLQVREDDMSLYGFTSEEERDLFEMLITVSGIGPKVAMSALSALTPSTFKEAVIREDAGMIAQTPGIGKKTAQRVIVELKDKFAAPDLIAAGTSTSAVAEAVLALTGMGFTQAEASAAVRDFQDDEDIARVEDVVRHALRRLGQG